MNEYLEKFEELRDQHTFRGEQWFGKRQDLVKQYSWAVTGESAVTYLAEFDELVEVGAGNGWWKKCIEKGGGSVSASDKEVPDETWATVTEMSVDEALSRSSPDAVLTVWPPLDGRVAVAIAAERVPHILYIGEPRGGCTASDYFFDEMERHYALLAKVDIPSYKGINDNLYHYVRKT